MVDALLNARERFIATLHFQRPDRIPLHDEEIRQEILEGWHEQGLPKDKEPWELFQLERWERVPVNLDMIPEFQGRLRSRKDFERLKRSYNPDDPSRYPSNWENLVRRWRNRDYPLGITAWPGLFEPLNVSDSPTLKDILLMIYLDPELLEEMTRFIADFSIRTISRALNDLEIDYAIMSEPIAENKGPVISPSSFRRFVIPCYKKIVKMLHNHGLDVIILSTFGNVKKLIPLCLEAGVNGLWCRGTKLAGVDYVSLRKKYGRRLLLIGGIDIGSLTRDRKAIEAEILFKVPYLISSGGYIPMVDNRVRHYVPFKNYAYYRTLIAKLAKRI